MGWAAGRFKLLKPTDANGLTAAYLYIFLPALIVDQIAKQDPKELWRPGYILATFILLLGLYAIAFIVEFYFLKRPLAVSGLAAFAVAKFNAAVLGLPLLLVSIGHYAVPAVLINVVIGYCTILPVTLTILEISKQRESARALSALGRAVAHAVRDPLILATAMGCALSLAHIRVPGWLDQTLVGLGGAAFTVPLVALGLTLHIPSHDELRDVSWIVVARLIVSPLLAITLAKSFALSPPDSIALVISFCLPTAKLAFAIAEGHDTYVEQTSAIVAITTVGIAVTFPLWMSVCAQLWPGTVAVPR